MCVSPSSVRASTHVGGVCGRAQGTRAHVTRSTPTTPHLEWRQLHAGGQEAHRGQRGQLGQVQLGDVKALSCFGGGGLGGWGGAGGVCVAWRGQRGDGAGVQVVCGCVRLRPAARQATHTCRWLQQDAMKRSTSLPRTCAPRFPRFTRAPALPHLQLARGAAQHIVLVPRRQLRGGGRRRLQARHGRHCARKGSARQRCGGDQRRCGGVGVQPGA
jgi:hypothetical protein